MKNRIKSLLLVLCIIICCCNVSMQVHARKSSEDSREYSTTEPQNNKRNYYIEKKGRFDFDKRNNILGQQIGGVDARKIVPDGDLSRMPYKCIGVIKTSFKKNKDNSVVEGTGTAFLVGKSIILTDAHCVYKDGCTRLWSDFYPQYNGVKIPFIINCGNDHVAPEYKTAAKNNDEIIMRRYDYALVELKQDVGSQLGWLELGGYNTSINENFLVGKRCVVLGYASDSNKGRKLFRQKGTILGFELNTHLTYMMDTVPGMSGGPLIYPASNGKYYVVGLHFGIYDDTHNCARYITKRIYNLVNKYK